MAGRVGPPDAKRAVSKERLRLIPCSGHGCLSALCYCSVSLFFASSGHRALADESGQSKNIFVLYSFSERRLFDPLDDLKSAIRSRLNSPVNFYVHYMEAQGFEDPLYEQSLSETLSREYKGVKLDLVIVAAYPALHFALTYRDQIFPGVPVLFCYVYGGRLEGKPLWPGVTGVTISVGVRDTLDLAFRLHPRRKIWPLSQEPRNLRGIGWRRFVINSARMPAR